MGWIVQEFAFLQGKDGYGDNVGSTKGRVYVIIDLIALFEWVANGNDGERVFISGKSFISAKIDLFIGRF